MTLIPYKTAVLLRQQTENGALKIALRDASDYNSEFSLLLARFNKISKNEREGLISYQDAEIEINKLRKSFLETVAEFAENEPKIKQSETDSGAKIKPVYLALLKDVNWCYKLEFYLINNWKKTLLMLAEDQKHILAYYYLQQQHEKFKEAISLFNKFDKTQSTYNLSLGQWIQEVEEILGDLVVILDGSQIVDHVLFQCQKRLSTQLDQTRKTLIKSVTSDSDKEKEKYKLVEIVIPQLKIELEQIMEQISLAKSDIQTFSRN